MGVRPAEARTGGSLGGRLVDLALVGKELTGLGWTVVRIWEHESAAEAADGISQVLDVP